MKLIDLTCSKCGATLQVNQELKKCMCQYCGNEMLIDDEIIHHSLDNGFDFGYQTELGRMQAQQNTVRQQEIQNTAYQQNQSIKQYMTSNKQIDKTIDLILCIFLGFFGVHKFYEGKVGIGILYLLTFGLFGIGWIVDIILIAVSPNASSNYSMNTANTYGMYTQVYNVPKGINKKLISVGIFVGVSIIILGIVIYGGALKQYKENPPIMPDVSGMSYSNAKEVIQSTSPLELNISKENEYSDSVEKGKITRTYPEVGTQLSYNDKIIVFISAGKEPSKENDIERNEKEYAYTITFNTKEEYSYNITDLSVDEPKIELVTRESYDGFIEHWAILPAGTYEVTLADVEKKCQADHRANVEVADNKFYGWEIGTNKQTSESWTIQDCPNDNNKYYYDIDLNTKQYWIYDDKYTLTGINPDIEYKQKAIVRVNDEQVVYIDVNSSGYAYTEWHKLK